MSQVTKLDLQVKNTHLSAVEMASEILEVCGSDKDIINIFAITIKSNGNYRMYASANIGRHQKLGILAEAMHNLIVAE